ncbi:MAG: hypothetical protein JSS66_08535 [Armatimonadetes bacterium]|nr:hypothetical protein [Armatimonadota bacterium]
MSRRFTVRNHGEALRAIEQLGDVAIVSREGNRAIVMHCPDGCGEILTVNLDPRAGKAWRLFETKRGVTLFPSVWRSTGCRCHFILWDDVFFWFDGGDWAKTEVDRNLDKRVLAELTAEFDQDFESVADRLQEIPWAILEACRRLVLTGQAIAVDRDATKFRRATRNK